MISGDWERGDSSMPSQGGALLVLRVLAPLTLLVAELLLICGGGRALLIAAQLAAQLSGH